MTHQYNYPPNYPFTLRSVSQSTNPETNINHGNMSVGFVQRTNGNHAIYDCGPWYNTVTPPNHASMGFFGMNPGMSPPDPHFQQHSPWVGPQMPFVGMSPWMSPPNPQPQWQSPGLVPQMLSCSPNSWMSPPSAHPQQQSPGLGPQMLSCGTSSWMPPLSPHPQQQFFGSGPQMLSSGVNSWMQPPAYQPHEPFMNPRANKNRYESRSSRESAQSQPQHQQPAKLSSYCSPKLSDVNAALLPRIQSHHPRKYVAISISETSKVFSKPRCETVCDTDIKSTIIPCSAFSECNTSEDIPLKHKPRMDIPDSRKPREVSDRPVPKGTICLSPKASLDTKHLIEPPTASLNDSKPLTNAATHLAEAPKPENDRPSGDQAGAKTLVTVPNKVTSWLAKLPKERPATKSEVLSRDKFDATVNDAIPDGIAEGASEGLKRFTIPRIKSSEEPAIFSTQDVQAIEVPKTSDSSLGHLEVHNCDYNTSNLSDLRKYMKMRFMSWDSKKMKLSERPRDQLYIEALELYNERVQTALKEVADAHFRIEKRAADLLIVCSRGSSGTKAETFHNSVKTYQDEIQKIFVDNHSDGAEPREAIHMGLIHKARIFSLSSPPVRSRTRWWETLVAMKKLKKGARVVLLTQGRDCLCVAIDEWVRFYETFSDLNVILWILEHRKRVAHEIPSGWQQFQEGTLWQAYDLSRLIQVHRGEVQDKLYSRLLENWRSYAEYLADLSRSYRVANSALYSDF